MNVLVIGNGGREHCIIWKLSKSSKVKNLYNMPGNGGIQELSIIYPHSDWSKIDELIKFIEGNSIDLTVIGPEAPLVKGIVNGLNLNGKLAFGPSCQAALLEGSKIWCKEFLNRNSIPTAQFKAFTQYIDAEKYIKDRYRENKDLILVIKADGLAAGKGVFISKSKSEAIESIQIIMTEKKFGAAGEKIIIEEYLNGTEVSLLVFTDGKTVLPMVTAQDYKQAYDHHQGPNTGGMGCISPSPIMTPQLQDKILNKVIYPTINGLQKEGIQYIGVLYAGLMLKENEPFVLEYNCRFGDPETQVILPRLKTDLLDIFMACVEQKLDKIKIDWDNRSALCVVLASGGYPAEYKTGYPITGLDKFSVQKDEMKDILIFHAGTDYCNGKYITSGGRVLNIIALDKDIPSARNRVYKAIREIHFENIYYRTDIGKI